MFGGVVRFGVGGVVDGSVVCGVRVGGVVAYVVLVVWC